MRFNYFKEMLKNSHSLTTASKIYAHILACEELTKEEKKTLSEIYDALTAKMRYVADAGEC